MRDQAAEPKVCMGMDKGIGMGAGPPGPAALAPGERRRKRGFGDTSEARGYASAKKGAGERGAAGELTVETTEQTVVMTRMVDKTRVMSSFRYWNGDLGPSSSANSRTWGHAKGGGQGGWAWPAAPRSRA